jgi:uncharacterized protein YkwD
MSRTSAAAWAVAALVAVTPAIAAASANKSSSDTGACRGAYVIATDAPSRRQASDAVLCLVNRVRASHGLPAVHPSGQLATAAAGHSADMIARKYFSHTGRNGDTVQQRVTRTGYAWSAVGETIAWGTSNRAMPYLLVAAFLDSPEHRAIMLDRHYREVGIGLGLGAPQRNAPTPSATLTLDFGAH